jgi:putative methionine-R-sulfoxide reductase with GAF domain
MGLVEFPQRSEQGEQEERKDVVLRIISKPKPPKLPIHFPSDQGITGKAMETGEIQNVGDVRAPEVKYFKMLGEDVRSELAIPMFSGEGVFAVFNLERKNSGKFSREQETWARLYASLAGYAILSTEADLAQMQVRSLRHFQRDVMRDLLEDDPHDEKLLSKVARLALALTGQPDGYASFWRTEGDKLRRIAFYTEDGGKLNDLESATTFTQIFRQRSAWANTQRASGWPYAVWQWFTRRISVQGQKPRDMSTIPRAFARTGMPSGNRLEDSLPGGIIGEADDSQQPILALDIAEDHWKSVYKPRWKDTKSELAVPVFDRTQPKGTMAYVLGVLNVESPRLGDFETRHIEVLESLAQITSAALSARLSYREKLAPLQDDGYL